MRVKSKRQHRCAQEARQGASEAKVMSLNSDSNGMKGAGALTYELLRIPRKRNLLKSSLETLVGRPSENLYETRKNKCPF
jgi:hypothetical protein